MEGRSETIITYIIEVGFVSSSPHPPPTSSTSSTCPLFSNCDCVPTTKNTYSDWIKMFASDVCVLFWSSFVCSALSHERDIFAHGAEIRRVKLLGPDSISPPSKLGSG